MNFLMDRSATNWAKYLGELKAQTGECDSAIFVVSEGAMAGRFRWSCQNAWIEGQLLLAPTTPATVQAWRMRVLPMPIVSRPSPPN
jgi:serine-type D-Ala-D-Ala carboxypeptidase/endopeptidase